MNREYGVMESTVNEGCCVKPRTIADMSREMREMLAEALMIMSEMGTSLFGDAPIEGERPEAKCFEHDMDLNCAGMSSLLCGLRMLRDRLY